VRHRSTQYVSSRANNDLVLLHGDVVDGALNVGSLSRLRGAICQALNSWSIIKLGNPRMVWTYSDT
jgi:hypothetical protein